MAVAPFQNNDWGGRISMASTTLKPPPIALSSSGHPSNIQTPARQGGSCCRSWDECMLTELISNWAVQCLEVAGYSGAAALMAMESMIVPVPSEAVMPFVGFLVADG